MVPKTKARYLNTIPKEIISVRLKKYNKYRKLHKANAPAHQEALPGHHRDNMFHLLSAGRLQFAPLRLRLFPLGVQASHCTYLYHSQSQKPRLFYLFVATWIVDFIWVVYWGATWSSDEYQLSGASGSSTFVLTLSIISFITKVIDLLR